MPRQLGAFEDHVVQVREERVVGHGCIGDVDRDRVVLILLRRPPAGDRHVRQALQELLPQVHRPIGERARALRVPVEVGHRRRAIDRHEPFTAPSRNHSAFMARRKMSWPNAWTMPPT